MKQIRILETKTVKDCYKEFNYVLAENIETINQILIEARLNTMLDEASLLVVLREGRELINVLKASKLSI